MPWNRKDEKDINEREPVLFSINSFSHLPVLNHST